MKDKVKNCCRNCGNAIGYSGHHEHECKALGHCIRGEQYNCLHFEERKTNE